MGDVFLHTLPHVMGGGHPHDDHHGGVDNPHKEQQHHHHEGDETTTVDAGMWILMGFFVFFTVDVLLRVTEDTLHNGNTMHGPSSHSHSHPAATTCNGDATNHNNSTATTEKDRKSWSLIVLNVTADALHNFTDGLAIGASYAAAASPSLTSPVVVSPGSVATLSILLHEVPHELGDYCTLVAAGYTPWQAVRTQFITAIAAFCGTAVALVATSAEDDDTLILATAGGFLYLAGTTLLPHVLNESVAIPWHRLGHLVAFAVGLAFMKAVALLEEAEHHHSGHYNEPVHHHHHHPSESLHHHHHHHHDTEL